MPDEYIDILEKTGKPSGKVVLKSEAHRLGLYHASVHIWFFTKEGNILLQQRAHDKDTYPDLWDVSVAGHIGAGEKVINAALREIKEEIGLTIKESDLESIGTYLAKKKPAPDIIDNEFHHIFLSKLNTFTEELSLQKEEVAAVSLVPINDFRSYLNDTQLAKKYVPHDREYYDLIIKEITNRL